MLMYEAFARGEEARQAKGLAEIADAARPFAGGTAGKSIPGSWSNSSVGMGLKGPVSQQEVDEVVAWFEASGIEPRFEVCPFADPSLLVALEAHRCVPLIFENTFFLALSADPAARVSPLVPVPRGLKIERVDPSDEAAVRRYSSVSMSGFLPPGESPREEDFAISARVVRHPRAVAMLATIDGEPAGAGAAEVSDPTPTLQGARVIAMFGASVLPQFRNRGVQQALMAARLNHGIDRGAVVASIGAKPGIATERNARRMGFQLAYTKVHVVKPGAGLVRNQG